MTQKEFEKLLDKNSYQVFLFASRANLPFVFAIHPWFVINQKGVISRFGVAYSKNIQPVTVLENQAHWGHLYKNYLSPWQGIRVFPFYWRYLWKGKLFATVEGTEGSIAQKITDFIARSGEEYPYKDRYSLLGPNSNTYVQWVLSAFPEWKVKLPWNAFGKNFKDNRV